MGLRRIVALLILLSCFAVDFAIAKHRYTLVIDAGHGGKDAGACTRRSKEKTINLNVALAFGRYVERNCPDVRVIYTRKTDVFIPLHERAAIANRNKADVFISIHTNSVASKRPISGMETYTMGIRRSDEKLSAAQRENNVVLIEDNYRQHYAGYDPRSPESMLIFQVMNEKNMAASVELAQLIQKYTCSTARRINKGVKQDAFLVLRETSMPACLVELGYITTPAEEAFLTSKKNADRMGFGIYQAFVAFKNKHSGKGHAAVPTAEQFVETEEPAVEEPEVAEEPAYVEESRPSKSRKRSGNASSSSKTIFKVQFLTSNRRLKAKDSRLKGLKNVDCHKEGGVWKYTIGASSDYNEIYRLRKKILGKFPQAFIIAYRNGEKVDPGKAYQNYKSKKKKRKK